MMSSAIATAVSHCDEVGSFSSPIDFTHRSEPPGGDLEPEIDPSLELTPSVLGALM